MSVSISRILQSTMLSAALAVSTLGASVLGAQAQESTNVISNNTDWYVFEETSPTKMCWAVSKPKETVNTDTAGRAKSVTRSEILLLVSYVPANGVKSQVSFQGGYPFAGGSEVTLTIGGSTFALFTEGEIAWAATDADDARIIAAMKRGANAKLTARSARGTVTNDTFSLLGFTASVDDAAQRCS